MRCKNCGSENNENLYICQNCGSPLYEDDNANSVDEATSVFTPAAAANENSYSGFIDDFDNRQRTPRNNVPPVQQNGGKNDDSNKKQVALIVILSIILVAIIIAIVAAVVHAKKGANETTLPSFSTSETLTSETTTMSTTESTTKETTTEETTTSTTKKTTTEAKYEISVGTNNYGNADGGGTYKKGEKVKLWCSPDDGTEFVGWYKNGKFYSSKESITITVDGSAYYEARFKEVKTPDEPDADADTGEGL